MSQPIIEARGVAKVLGEGPARVDALRDVSLTLQGGELTMLMGPSGSGKTTLLSILGCMLAPSSGTVSVCGVNTAGAGAETLARLRRQHIGFIFQSYHLFPTLTAAENVQLALDLRGERGRGAMAKTCEALARVGLAHKIPAFPRELSGGEQQRVAIARALVTDPAAILADEPTAALDGKTGQSILGFLAAIAKDRNRSVLVVSHDSRLMAFAQRVVSIEDGRLTGEQRIEPTAPKLLTAEGGGAA